MKTFSPNLGPTNGMWQKIALGTRPRTSSSESESPTVHPESLVKSERKEEPAHKNTQCCFGAGRAGGGGPERASLKCSAANTGFDRSAEAEA